MRIQSTKDIVNLMVARPDEYEALVNLIFERGMVYVKNLSDDEIEKLSKDELFLKERDAKGVLEVARFMCETYNATTVIEMFADAYKIYQN
ncbi:MAG: hypothetical protein K6E13_04150 [Lachnospiraceae bacterium]|nr:hypothetical protein [Lachnospiraceae bacterium]